MKKYIRFLALALALAALLSLASCDLFKFGSKKSSNGAESLPERDPKVARENLEKNGYIVSYYYDVADGTQHPQMKDQGELMRLEARKEDEGFIFLMIEYESKAAAKDAKKTFEEELRAMIEGIPSQIENYRQKMEELGDRGRKFASLIADLEKDLAEAKNTQVIRDGTVVWRGSTEALAASKG